MNSEEFGAALQETLQRVGDQFMEVWVAIVDAVIEEVSPAIRFLLYELDRIVSVCEQPRVKASYPQYRSKYKHMEVIHRTRHFHRRGYPA